jgi:glycerophosphoryl diester phosphodiesterase
MLIYAHRGASADFPEHTEAAYRAAIEQGADGFECDLRLSRDRVPVLWHNASMLERAGNSGLIANMTFAEISRAYPQILTLNDFLDIAIANSKGVLLETKHPVITGNAIEAVVADVLSDRKVLKKIPVSVMSFSWSAVEKLHRTHPEIPTTFLLSERTRWFQARFSSAATLAPSMDGLKDESELIDKTRALGKKVAIWTVDRQEDVRMCRDLGVDILITNTPSQARSFL